MLKRNRLVLILMLSLALCSQACAPADAANTDTSTQKGGVIVLGFATPIAAAALGLVIVKRLGDLVMVEYSTTKDIYTPPPEGVSGQYESRQDAETDLEKVVYFNKLSYALKFQDRRSIYNLWRFTAGYEGYGQKLDTNLPGYSTCLVKVAKRISDGTCFTRGVPGEAATTLAQQIGLRSTLLDGVCICVPKS